MKRWLPVTRRWIVAIALIAVALFLSTAVLKEWRGARDSPFNVTFFCEANCTVTLTATGDLRAPIEDILANRCEVHGSGRTGLIQMNCRGLREPIEP